MKDHFETAGGSIVGKDHSHPLVNKNNQDAWRILARDYCLIALVADGCGSEPHSEIGAKLGLEIAIQTIHRELGRADIIDEPCFWEVVRAEILGNLQRIMQEIGGDMNRVVKEYFFFTLAGAVVLEHKTVLFSLGDAVFCLNGEIFQAGPYPGNEPPYIAYGMPGIHVSEDTRKHAQFSVHKVIPTRELQSLLVGTDGVAELIAKEGALLPGKKEVVGPIAQFWEEDKYFLNPDAIRRKLALINKDSAEVNWAGTLDRANGLLADDTTFVVIRKKGG